MIAELTVYNAEKESDDQAIALKANLKSGKQGKIRLIPLKTGIYMSQKSSDAI
jgi:hypothetical protein